ncbi:2-amino-4-hydroxy-6-hydroxymethyldihydropteridine pyrophosphokinase [beta proteobacterium AAP121]|nr:2-amino-4-hydroxy-6-hydroxymethyldihydropteridine pyrophosphokinase [beta proteobacterium AAP65]KPG00252.1 2-amino-4-hydroxy-6-hydroxymethyldihydropteridine pyrophosphokinase [beta proteobacterium AAP121]
MSARVRACIGLGANLGDARATLRAAVAALATLPGTALLQVSHVYRSAPVDARGPDFLNAVATVETTLAPLELLQALQAVEHAHGRERPFRNAPRTLDLDLLLHGETVMETPELTLPHPRLHERHFVLAPLLELVPDLQHPLLGPLQALLPQVAGQAVLRLPEVLTGAP